MPWVPDSEDDYLEVEPSEPEEDLIVKKMSAQELKQRVEVLWKYISGSLSIFLLISSRIEPWYSSTDRDVGERGQRIQTDGKGQI